MTDTQTVDVHSRFLIITGCVLDLKEVTMVGQRQTASRDTAGDGNCGYYTVYVHGQAPLRMWDDHCTESALLAGQPDQLCGRIQDTVLAWPRDDFIERWMEAKS